MCIKGLIKQGLVEIGLVSLRKCAIGVPWSRTLTLNELFEQWKRISKPDIHRLQLRREFVFSISWKNCSVECRGIVSNENHTYLFVSGVLGYVYELRERGVELSNGCIKRYSSTTLSSWYSLHSPLIYLSLVSAKCLTLVASNLFLGVTCVSLLMKSVDWIGWRPRLFYPMLC